MLHQNTINELLRGACPSIRFRIRHEILGEPCSSDTMQVLQQRILQDPAVQLLVRSQQQDGWMGARFHGYDSLESSIRFLAEKGVLPSHPVLARALCAMQSNPARIEHEMGTVGRVLDERGLGGTRMIQAVILAYTGEVENHLVQDQVRVALEAFKAVLPVRSIDQLAEWYRGKLVFRAGMIWPGIYHLRLLAFTHAWRTAGNTRMLANALSRLVELSPLPYLLVRHGSQLIAPASFGMLVFAPASLTPADWMPWFQRMELMARLGLLGRIPALKAQLLMADQLLSLDDSQLVGQVRHDYFRKWGAYTGLMLEQDWRVQRRSRYDLAFRRLLIGRYACL